VLIPGGEGALEVKKKKKKPDITEEKKEYTTFKISERRTRKKGRSVTQKFNIKMAKVKRPGKGTQQSAPVPSKKKVEKCTRITVPDQKGPP